MIKNKIISFKYLILLLLLCAISFLNGCEKGKNFSANEPFRIIFSDSSGQPSADNILFYGDKIKVITTVKTPQGPVGTRVYYDRSSKVFNVVYDLQEKMGIKMKYDEYLSQGPANGEALDYFNFKDKMKDMVKNGTDKVLDYSCDVYTSKDGQYSVSVFKDCVPLRFTVSTPKGTVEITHATTFEPNLKIDNSEFIPPADINYKESGPPVDVKTK